MITPSITDDCLGATAPRAGPPHPSAVPDLRLMRYFIAVAEELSFTRAATRLYISQPSLSSAVRQLERLVCATLFQRDNRPVELTEAGRVLLPHARAALAAAERGVTAVRAIKNRADLCRLGYAFCLESVAHEALDRLEAVDPPHLLTGRGLWDAEALAELRTGRVDAVLVRFPEDCGDLDLEPLSGDTACALVAEDHALADRGVVSFAELSAEPVLLWAPELGFGQYNGFVENAYQTQGIVPRPFIANRLDVVRWPPVAAGKTAAIVGSAEAVPIGTAKIAIADAPRMPLFLCLNQDSRDSPVIPALIEAIQEAVLRRSSSVMTPARRSRASPTERG